MCPNNQLLNSEVAIMLSFQACSACYTAVQMERSASAINPATGVMEIWVIQIVKPLHATMN